MLTASEINFYRNQPDDTALHLKACELADNEAFRLYGTDSISEKDVLWPRWQELYCNVIKQVYGS
jgi:hypothetical protein